MGFLFDETWNIDGRNGENGCPVSLTTDDKLQVADTYAIGGGYGCAPHAREVEDEIAGDIFVMSESRVFAFEPHGRLTDWSCERYEDCEAS